MYKSLSVCTRYMYLYSGPRTHIIMMSFSGVTSPLKLLRSKIPFPPLLSPPLPLEVGPLEVGPLKPARGVWGAL